MNARVIGSALFSAILATGCGGQVDGSGSDTSNDALTRASHDPYQLAICGIDVPQAPGLLSADYLPWVTATCEVAAKVGTEHAYPAGTAVLYNVPKADSPEGFFIVAPEKFEGAPFATDADLNDLYTDAVALRSFACYAAAGRPGAPSHASPSASTLAGVVQNYAKVWDQTNPASPYSQFYALVALAQNARTAGNVAAATGAMRDALIVEIYLHYWNYQAMRANACAGALAGSSAQVNENITGLNGEVDFLAYTVAQQNDPYAAIP
jgi:hypothetical protein